MAIWDQVPTSKNPDIGLCTYIFIHSPFYVEKIRYFYDRIIELSGIELEVYTNGVNVFVKVPYEKGHCSMCKYLAKAVRHFNVIYPNCPYLR